MILLAEWIHIQTRLVQTPNLSFENAAYKMQLKYDSGLSVDAECWNYYKDERICLFQHYRIAFALWLATFSSAVGNILLTAYPLWVKAHSADAINNTHKRYKYGLVRNLVFLATRLSLTFTQPILTIKQRFIALWRVDSYIHMQAYPPFLGSYTHCPFNGKASRPRKLISLFCIKDGWVTFNMSVPLLFLRFSFSHACTPVFV